MPQATNCNESCSNYEDCGKDGVRDKFILGGECTDYSLKDDEA